MKKLKIIGILIGVILVTMLAINHFSTKKVYKVFSGNSKNIMSKSHLPVNIEYVTEQVDVNESSNVEITFVTSIKEGNLKVQVKDLENTLEGLDDMELNYLLSEGTSSFPLNLQVSSEIAGIHYISMLLTLEGKGSKVLVVPVYIGKVVAVQRKNQQIIQNSNGVIFSISHAEEVIK